MNTERMKDLAIASVLISVGYIVNSISPILLFGLKPDFALVFLFIVIITVKDFKLCLAASVVTGVITALTTTFPGGQMPNLVDKIVTGIAIYFLCRVLERVSLPQTVKLGCVAFVGSLLSGVLFLSITGALVGLPVSMQGLVATMIIPLALLNTVIFVPLCHIMVRVRNSLLNAR